MSHRPVRSLLLVAVTVGLVGSQTAVGAQSPPPLRAQTVLPPGNSMLFTVYGVVAGNLSGEPDDYGPWVDDQRELYWDYGFKDGGFLASPQECQGGAVAATERASGLEAIDGRTTRICWSDYGVPAVFADTAEDLWYGSGWAAGKLRLFLMDAIRRTARGTLAELAGAGSSGETLAEDIRTRYQTYSDEEYTAFYEALSPQARVGVDAYVAGVNDWIAFVTQGPGLELLPAEYALLTSVPQELTPEDVIAIGVLMTRFVASEGKKEFQWVRALKSLEAEFGPEQGRALFLDFVSQEDDRAMTTVLPSEGVFPRTEQTPTQRAAAFDELADWAVMLPHDLDIGPGADADQQGGVPAAGQTQEAATVTSAAPAAVAAAALQEWTSALTGGSFQVSIAPNRTADGSALLISQPQLGYDPVLLMEVQLTGAGYNARGVTVPGIPVVGIGYTPTVAWSLTTGNSKTIDTFVETVRPDTDEDGAPEYFHEGEWKNSTCRVETVAYRQSPEGVPVGPPVFSEDHAVCRTTHGPIVAPSIDAIDEEGDLALAYEWHMFGREIDTVEGVLRWNRAESAQDIIDSIPLLTWNENVGWADSAGNIGWWHPGLHRRKAAGADLRLPLPGTGQWDNGDYMPHTALPHVVNPQRGWIVNWNNKPARGWLDGGGQSEASFPAGIDVRGATLADVVAARDDWTFHDLVELDRQASSQDFRVRHFLPMILALDPSELGPAEQQALELLGRWDGSANGPGADMEFAGYEAGPDGTTVGAAPTIFTRMMDVLVADLFAFMREVRYEEDDQEWTFDLVGRQLQMGRHVYDMSPPLHVALRALDPSTSTLDTARDYLRGRTASEVLADVLQETVAQLTAESGDDPTAWRSVYGDVGGSTAVCNPTRALGPCGHMPFLERGTWIHYAGWPSGPTSGGESPTPAPEVPTPVTGGGAVILALVAMALATVRRR